MIARTLTFFIFFFNDTATTEIYTLSLHDALPIFHVVAEDAVPRRLRVLRERRNRLGASTRRWFEYETAHSAPSSSCCFTYSHTAAKSSAPRLLRISQTPTPWSWVASMSSSSRTSTGQSAPARLRRSLAVR